MGRRSGGLRQRRAHGRAVKQARAARRARAEARLQTALRPWRIFRVK